MTYTFIKILKKYFVNIKALRILASVFIGYGLKTGQGVYPGPFYF